VLIIEVDHLNTETAHTSLASRADIVGPPVEPEKGPVGAAYDAEFRGNHQVVTRISDRAPEKLLVVADAIDVRCIEQGYATVDCAPHGGNGLVVVTRPIKFRHPNAAQAERRDLQSRLTSECVCISDSLEMLAVIGP
jgi:hypothetical protein